MSRGRTKTENTLEVVPDRREKDPSVVRRRPGEPAFGGLPLEPSSFVGRERELEEVGRLLSRSRLLTLTGAGGSGKTRLALQAAGHLARGFDDGACLVELAPLSDPDLVAGTLARSLGVRDQSDISPSEAIVRYLSSRELLLLLDNCEHLVEACAALVDILLRSCPRLRVLATGREPLGVPGEWVWVVPPLSLPDSSGNAEGRMPDVSDAVRLFVDRASAASGFALAPDEAAAVSQVCRRLEGMPLAIELAAARTRALSVGQILERLDDCFTVLTGGNRTADVRHRTLSATMDWSHDLLCGEEKVLFRRLSVFAGGWTLPAAEKVCAGESIREGDVLDLLAGLVDKSLVVVARGDEVRYRMLEPIRQYARGKLEESGEEAEIRGRHAGFFLALAEEAEPALPGPEQAAWLVRLEQEYDNLRRALAWLREEGYAERGLRLGGALWRFWWLRGHFAEGKAQLEALLELRGARGRTKERAKGLFVLGELARRRGDYGGGDHTVARRYQEESLGIYRELRDRERTAAALSELGRIGLELEDWETAHSFLEESLKLERDSDDEHGLAVALESLGWLAHFEGNDEAARPFIEEALVIFGRLGDSLYVGICLWLLGSIAVAQGDYAAARARLVEIAQKAPLMQYRWAVPCYLEGWSILAAAQGLAVRALRLAGAATALRETIGASVTPAWRSYMESRLQPAWRALGREESAAAFEGGRAMTLERALAYALEPEAPPRGHRGRSLLSARELEVLGLVAEGLTDAEIAHRLYVSPRTVGWHLGSAYRKLGVKGRTAALRRATELGLL